MTSEPAVSTSTSSTVGSDPAEQASTDAATAPEPGHTHRGERRYRRRRHRRKFSGIQRFVKRRAAVIAGCVLFIALYAWIMFLLFGVFQKI